MSSKNIETRTIEIRAGEGGEDARLFVAELATAYIRLADRVGWLHRATHVPNQRTGHQTLTLEITGEGASRFDGEAGGHRIQRVPRTERNGRVHSSTVTVAVIAGAQGASQGPPSMREPGDYELCWFSGTGAGGQHRNINAPTPHTMSSMTMG